MTLLIALFLFVQFDAHLGWYVAAVVVWALHLPYHADFIRHGADPEGPFLAKIVVGFGIVAGGIAAVLANPESRDFIFHQLSGWYHQLLEGDYGAPEKLSLRSDPQPPTEAGVISVEEVRAIAKDDPMAPTYITDEQVQWFIDKATQ